MSAKPLLFTFTAFLLGMSGLCLHAWYRKATEDTRLKASSCKLVAKEPVQLSSTDTRQVGKTRYTTTTDYGAVQVTLECTSGGRTVRATDTSKGDKDFSVARRLHDSLQVGSEYPCWLDPADPRECVMFRRKEVAAYVISTFVCLFGAGFVFFVARVFAKAD